MKRKNYLLLFALLCLCTMTSWAQQLTEPERTVVYDMNYEGSKFYRIPSLVTAANGDLLAIADRRGDKLGDLPNDISVVCRRSTDNGKTWSKPITIAQGLGEGKGYGDPLTIPYTTKEGKHGLVCIFAGGNGLWKSTPYNKITFNMSRSTDNGVTWTKPVDFSETIYSATGCYGAFAGSGHGLQLKDGRLMFVIAASLNYQPDGGALYNYAVYSDDYGKTWQVSKNHVAQRGDEAKVVELENGNILMSIRSKGYRLFSVSTDRGETWGDAVPNYDLPDPACNGDIIRYPAKDGDNSFLIQSLPASTTMRTNVTVYASFDEGQTWKTKKLITDGYSAYSSMTVLKDGTIGMIVENGKWDSSIKDVEDGFVLEFVRFTKEWLLEEEGNGGEELPKGVLACNGVDRYMTIPNSPDFFPTAGGEYTVTCRVKVPKYISGSNMRFLCARGYTGTDNNQISGYDFFGANSYQESFSVNLSLVGKPWSAGHAFAAGAINEGEWAHLAWTFNGATKQSYIYVDGMRVGEKSIPEYATNAWANELPVLVGAGYTNTDGSECVPSFFATAEIDDVRFFNKALSQAEVTADKTAKVTATTEGLVAAYDFENIQGTTVPDISGKGHNGTLVNFPNQSAKHKVTITKPDSKEGTLRVLNGTKEVPNGFMVAEGTTLTVDAQPTEQYTIKEILVNGNPIKGTTFVLNDKDVTVSVTFEKKKLPGADDMKGILACNSENKSYMRIPGSAKLYPATGGNFTVTCKVKVPKFVSNSDMRFIANRSYNGTDNDKTVGYELFGGNSASKAYSVNLSMNGKAWSAGLNKYTSMNENEWTHISWTFDGKNQVAAMYVNGVEKVSRNDVAEYKTNSWESDFDVLVGAGYQTNVKNQASIIKYFADAEIDDVRFFDKTLSAEELVADMTATVDDKTPNLLAAYDFENMSGTTVPDISGNGHDGTLVNFPAQSVKHQVNVSTPDAKQGKVQVMNGSQEVKDGEYVPEGSILTINTTAETGYQLNDIKVNGKLIKTNTVKVTGDTKIAVSFTKSFVYCGPKDNSRQNKITRRLKTITVTGATFEKEDSPFNVTLNNTNGQTNVVQDLTDHTLYASIDNELKVTWTLLDAIAEWIHYYMYIDYNQDGEFDTKNELVSYSCLNVGTGSNEKWQNSKGEEVYGNKGGASGNSCKELPTFTIPSTAKLGKTRIRLKADWDSSDPCGSSDINNSQTNGTIVDFNIYIGEGPKGKVTIEQPATGGTIEVKDAGLNVIKDQQSVRIGTELFVTATPNEGYQLKHILVNDKEQEGNSFIVEQDTKVSAEFTNQIQMNYSISEGYTITGKYGDSTVTSGDWVAKGQNLVLNFNVPAGNKLTSVKVNGEEKISDEVKKNNSYTVENCQVNQTVVVTAEKIMHTITIAETINGGITVINNATEQEIANGESVAENDEITIKVEPFEGYYIETFTIDGEDKKVALGTSGQMTLKVTKGISLNATFKEYTFKLSWTVEGKGTVTAKDYTDDEKIVSNGDQVGIDHEVEFLLTPQENSTVSTITKNKETIKLEDNIDLDKETYPNSWAYYVSMTQDTELVFTFSTNTGIAKAFEIFLGYNACTETLLIPENATAEIYDLTGKEVMYMSETTASTSNLNNGCYLVKIKMGDTTKTFKFVK